MRQPFIQTAFVTVLWLQANILWAGDDTEYVREIKPIFKARCYACHGALKQESGLRLDTAAVIQKGGTSGPAVSVGKPGESLLIARISAEDADERMPPEGEPLTAKQIAAVRQWIASGAAAPEQEVPEADPLAHWAFKKIVRPSVPLEFRSELLGNPIDAFLAQRQQSQNFPLQPPATKSVLLRRVYLNLLGIPPTREDLHAFLSDQSPDAYHRTVERLLNSPRYGERWGRHWMDIWRYSDWYGRRHVPDVWNSAPQVWRWRDWIVDSLNGDRGYDQMIHEMLAADEIVPTNDQAGYATGYLVRNWYALNPNDWMRSVVEHTGKSFLGLTFNCAHCHDHKYDPISHADYFRFRAFFEPIAIRQDRVPYEADPGPFQEYDYSTLRKIQRLGAVRIYDRNPNAPTWFYTGGDERNRVKERGSIPPGVPTFLAESQLKIAPVNLPVEAWYPGLRAGIIETLYHDARKQVQKTSTELVAVTKSRSAPSADLLKQLEESEHAYAQAIKQAAGQNVPGALVGQQSLFFDATSGRRLVQNGLAELKSFEENSTLEFEVLLLTQAHFNFQLAKDKTKGLTAGYVGFDQGRIVSYRPGSFAEFEAGRFDFASGQRRFHVVLKFEKSADRCLLTVRSVSDGKMLVDGLPVALNAWNPVGDSTKAITFDARVGSQVVLDEILLRGPNAQPLIQFDFELPKYLDGQDVVGLHGWISSSFSQAPASSQISAIAGNADLYEVARKLAVAKRAVEAATLPLRMAQAQDRAARAAQASIEARIAAEQARYQTVQQENLAALVQKASRREREAVLRQAEANVLAQEFALANAEALAETEKTRAQKIQTATHQLAVVRSALAVARYAMSDDSIAETYTPLSLQFPKTSTGRRRALALWMTRRDNPLTVRVAVNHVWMRHFHQPLVASVYDFGRNGTEPTHPELLDWLAMELMDSGWSFKHLHRLILTSKAYQRSSSSKGASGWMKVDLENRLLWRMNSGRMEAEVVRDSLLACGGVLESNMGGQELENDVAFTTHRRSLYYSVHPEQGGRNAMGALFDAPDPLDCYRRTRSILPQQALALTNSDLVHDMGARLVHRVSTDGELSAFITTMFEQILSRKPTAAELEVCQSAVQAQQHLLATKNTDKKTANLKACESLVRALFNHNDFITIR